MTVLSCMSMIKGRFYMHKNCMDVCVRVVGNVYEGTTKLKFKGEWWNLGYAGEPFPILPSSRVAIFKSTLPEWIDITAKINNVRAQPGLPT